MHHPCGHARPAMISGRALHTGTTSIVCVTPRADDGRGLRFLFPGFPAPLTARDLATLPRAARRATVLTHPSSGAVIRTPEHLLAAALFFAAAPLDIHCDHEEIPGLDGSAAPWFGLLAAACATLPNAGAADPVPPRSGAPGDAHPPRPAPSCREYACDLTWSHEGPEGVLHAEPAPRFSVRYTLERGAVRQTFALARSEAAPTEVLPARTFIFWKDWEALTRARGDALLEGAEEGSGLLLAESHEEFARVRTRMPRGGAAGFPLLHPHALRMPDEAVRHKVLDLLGDLALNGLALPRLELTVTGGGHALNHLLLDALRAHAGPQEAGPTTARTLS